MDCIPHEGKWSCKHQKRRSNTTEVIKMLHWMHAQSGKRFNVSVTMVQGMDVLVHGFDMDKPKTGSFLAQNSSLLLYFYL